jgi:hypothetical protein
MPLWQAEHGLGEGLDFLRKLKRVDQAAPPR